jgi:two-component system OmpR family response regulator
VNGGIDSRTILVIDENDVVLDATRAALESTGYRVITRNRPSGSISAIFNERPDIVLIDLNMPTLSGEAILKVFGKSHNRPDSMVLLHSSLPLELLRAKANEVGAHGYIQKTEIGTEFLRRLEYWVRRTPNTSSGRFRAARPVEGSAAPQSVRESDPASVRRMATPTVVGTKTLFVDDDWTTLNTYKTAIGSALDAEYVTSGEEAIARIVSSSPPRIVVCDLVMPFLSGADVYKRALASDTSWSHRFVFVTGAASQKSVAAFLNGVDARIMFKPVLPERLLEAIRRVEAALSAR